MLALHSTNYKRYTNLDNLICCRSGYHIIQCHPKWLNNSPKLAISYCKVPIYDNIGIPIRMYYYETKKNHELELFPAEIEEIIGPIKYSVFSTFLIIYLQFQIHIKYIISAKLFYFYKYVFTTIITHNKQSGLW